MAAPTNAPADASAPPESQDPPPATGAGNTDGQLVTVDGQALGSRGQTTAPEGQQGSATTPWTMSSPALRSSISFANALPPMPPGPITQQDQARVAGVFNIHPGQHQGTAAAAGGDGASTAAQQQVHASVSEWLLHQVSGDVDASWQGSGDCLVRMAPGEEDEQSQASGSGDASDADAAGLQVTPCC